jgi:hypothetical protein
MRPSCSKPLCQAALAALALICSSSVLAQTQAQHDRLDQIARYVVTAPMCQRLGMRVDPNLPAKVEAAVAVETSSWSVDPSTLSRLKSEAISRQGAILKTDLQTAADSAKTDAQLRNVRSILIGYGRTCLAAATDTIFSAVVIAPSGYDLDKAATAAADEMLEAGGLASWETPKIQARGDLMMLAGTCRSKIGAVRSDALVREFGQTDDPRIRAYYARSFDEGLADQTTITTLAGCNRAIAAYRLKAQ